MVLTRIIHSIRQRDWFIVLVELIVVMVGLLLAFQLDRWWEQRGEQAKEAEYIARLIADVKNDVPIIEYAVKLASLRQDMADMLMAVSADPEAAMKNPALFLVGVTQAAFTYSPNLAAHTFEDMRSTGNLRLLRDPAIKNLMYDYYDYDRSQNQYRPLQFMTESRHFELAAGVLSHEHSRLVQDEWYVASPGDLEKFDPSRLDVANVMEAANRLAARKELVAWLPEVRHLQIEQKLINQNRLDRAKNVLRTLERYSVELR